MEELTKEQLQAQSGVYDSIDMLERLHKDPGFTDPGGSSEERAELKRQIHGSNLQFLKNVLELPYYEGIIDRERVEAAIAKHESDDFQE